MLVRLARFGKWSLDGIRLRGNAWWPKQSLTVFQPLVPPDWKMNLRDGELYARSHFLLRLNKDSAREGTVC